LNGVAAKTIRDDWAPNESSTQIGFPMNNDGAVYDVVVIGGALSGAATATLLLRNNPGLNLLILEKSAQFTRRVGEATVEVSAFFMGRVLGMTKYLNECHLVKQGLRFWFTNDAVSRWPNGSSVIIEISPSVITRGLSQCTRTNTNTWVNGIS
jgi:2-polyprenyl-6-methoxyphenol hydroxylase-like FAD-dependent oxidoreductase